MTYEALHSCTPGIGRYSSLFRSMRFYMYPPPPILNTPDLVGPPTQRISIKTEPPLLAHFE